MIPDYAARDRKARTTHISPILIIVVVLAAFILVAAFISNRPGHVRESLTIFRLKSLRAALESFYAANGRYPTDDEGLDALVNQPADLAGTWQKCLDYFPDDSWGNPFVYHAPRPPTSQSYDLHSVGKDGTDDTKDDIYLPPP